MARTQSIICSQDDEAHLAGLAGHFPLVSRHRLAQAAYRFGLRSCAACPELILGEARLAEGVEATESAENPQEPANSNGVAPAPEVAADLAVPGMERRGGER